MAKAHPLWKPASILVFVIAAAGLVLGLFGPTFLYYVVASSLALASLGSLQFAFGWPRLPRLLWRIFGPLFSLIMIWPLAETVGWLATRLAIRHLSVGDWVATAGMLLFLTCYTLAIVVPLYRLGDWSNRNDRRESERLTELSDTFA